MDDAFTNGLKAAIEDDCHYRCRRIDAKEYNGDVVDELMAEIRESRFVVCDLTEHRNGVYFEGGFAMGLEIPTIWTCREDLAGKTTSTPSISTRFVGRHRRTTQETGDSDWGNDWPWSIVIGKGLAAQVRAIVTRR